MQILNKIKSCFLQDTQKEEQNLNIKTAEFEPVTLETVMAKVDEFYGGKDTSQKSKFNFFKGLFSNMSLNKPKDYLEIGSYKGISLVIVADLLKEGGCLGRIVSVDPYFEDGYFETPPNKEKKWKNATASTMEKALGLYNYFGLSVELIRELSNVALIDLLKKEDRFDLIFVDGNHEGLNPLIDFSLSTQLLKPGGIICLDDVNWPDIEPISALVEKHWKVVYKTRQRIAFQAPIK